MILKRDFSYESLVIRVREKGGVQGIGEKASGFAGHQSSS